MTEMTAPQDHERAAARMPHDIFLTNLIANHILLFTAIAATGKSYFEFIVLVPLLSFSFVGYTFFRSSRGHGGSTGLVKLHLLGTDERGSFCLSGGAKLFTDPGQCLDFDRD